MTPPPSAGGPAGVGGPDGDVPRTDRLPVVSAGGGAPLDGPPTRERSVAVLPGPAPEPAPEPAGAAPAGPRLTGIRGALARWPAPSRSTTLLLVLLAAVVLVAAGAGLERFTAPTDASPPVVTGSVESVTGDADGTQLTVRTPDGSLVVFAATNTVVGAPRAGGLRALRPGQQVTVDSETDQEGAPAARAVLVPAP